MKDDDTNMVENILYSPNVDLTVMLDTVKIIIKCASDYEARVLFDDLVERLESGQEISIKPGVL